MFIQKCWVTMDVIELLEKVITKSRIYTSISQNQIPAHQDVLGCIGYFAIICLQWVHILSNDYYYALTVVQSFTLSNDELYAKLPGSHISLFFGVGLCYLMVHRYLDSVQVLVFLILGFISLDSILEAF